MAEAPKRRRKVTLRTLMRKMRAGEQIVQMAIYDYRSAVIADQLGIDILCVSDTGGMILFGHQSTVTVTFDEVMMMAKAIDRGSRYGLRMVDMPYWSFHTSTEQAVENAGRFVHEANAEVMKCEGNRHHAKNIEAIVSAGSPGAGPHRHHADAHRPARRLLRPRQDRRPGAGARGRRGGVRRGGVLLDHDGGHDPGGHRVPGRDPAGPGRSASAAVRAVTGCTSSRPT